MGLARIRVGALAVAVLLLAALTSCEREPSTPDPVAPPTPTDTPAPESPKVLRLAMRELKTLDPGLTMTLDPGLARYSEALTIVNLLFEPLLTVDADGRVVPAAAEKWSATAGGQSFTFTLRPDLKWSDGSPLTAADFEYAWKRILDPETPSDSAYLLYAIAGAMDYADGVTADAGEVAIEALSVRELKVTLAVPSMSFPARIAQWPFAPVPERIVAAAGERWTEAANIAGNGPYMLAEWDHGESMRLMRNPNYRDPSRQPLDEIVVKLVGEDESLAGLFAEGQTDIVELGGDDLDRARDDETLRGRSAVYETAGNWFLVFNAAKEPWDDPRVRRAFSLALDRERLVGLVFEGAETPSASLLPTAARSSEAPQINPPDAVATAQALLAEAGYPGGEGLPVITFVYHQTARWDRLASYLQSGWSEVLGVEVEIDVREWRDFLDFTIDPGDFDLYRAGWNSEYLDPENWHNVLWSSSDDFLRSGWSDAEYDSLIERADHEDEPAARHHAYTAADAILDEAMPGIPLASRARAFLIGAGITGVRIDPLGGYLVLDEVGLPGS